MKSAQQEECILCCREIEIYATGACDHHVCYECSTRMRVLCETNECPVCRSNMPAVVFTHDRQLFSDVTKKFSLCFKKYNIIFEDEEVAEAFDRLLEHKCKQCDNILPTFEKLREHVRRTHELHYCELCTEHLKIFTFERKCYSRKDLARHKRHGDPDEKSHRGHPLCEYCDQRYVDADELFRHLRKEHFYCHFCDADGIYHYYKDYEYLRNHFRMEHYLCEEGSCINETFTSAFRSEIDLKAHIAVHHSKNKTKAEAKQARMLEFEFAYAHNRPSGSSSPRGGRYSQNRRRNVEENVSQTKADQQPEPENIDTQSVQEFPYLSEDSNNSDTLTLQSYCRNIKRNVMSAEDFPALSSATITTPSESFNNQSRKVNVSANPPQVQKRNVMSIENFPVLSSNTTPASSEGPKNQGKKINNITKSNTASKTSNVTSQFSLWGVPTQNISASSSDNKFKKVDVENGNRASQPKSKWSSKKSDFNFEEEFPSLEVKKNPPVFAAAASIPKVSSSTSNNSSMHRAAAASVPKVSSSTSNNSSTHRVPNVVAPKKSASSNIDNTDSASGDHFVIIKTKSKNKKQPRVYAPSDYETAEDSKPISFNKINMVPNDKNKNTFKKHLMEPSAPPKPKPSDTWGIDNLSFGNEDFPPLAPTEKPPLKKPPGLSITKSQVPPGFTANSTIKNSSIANKTLADVAREIVLPNATNGVNHQDTVQEYREPQNFVQRNTELIQKIIDLSDAETILFEEFKIASGKFRRNEISAGEYHAKCLDILGEKAILEIFPELVSLLPDIKKQQELLTVHTRYLSQINRGAVSKKSYKLSDFVVSCQQCKQVLEISDCKNHELLHIRNGSQ